MIRRRLKYHYLLLLLLTLLILPLFITLSSMESTEDDIIVEPDYVTDEVVDESLPVVNTTTRIIPPYFSQEVSIAKSYYDFKADETTQVNAILLYDNTYRQNTGIDYTSSNPFEVVSILNGSVIDISNDQLLGKTIKIQHDNGYISIYQSLNEVNVNKGDMVSQGQIIGTSGKNELEKELENHLHFEIYDNGQSLNPINYLNTEVS